MEIHHNDIISKLDSFIRKYYKNKLLKGLILAVALLLFLFLFIVALEAFGWFNTTVRSILFWLFCAALVVIVGFYIASPLSKMFRLGKCISHEDAAVIIGNHFPEISDKLLNLLQLHTLSSIDDNELLQASIEQKTELLSPLPFNKSINLKNNKKYLKYALLPLLIILATLLISPSAITDPSHRIIYYNQQFQKPAPFAFIIQNDTLLAIQNEDFQIRLLVDGDQIPDAVSVILGNNKYKMKKDNHTHFSYLLKNVRQNQTLRFEAAGINSIDYQLVVLPKPAVVNFQAVVHYPAYIGREPETFSNQGDLVVPKGSTISWLFHTKDADTLYFLHSEQVHPLPSANIGRTQYVVRALSSFAYSFFASSPTLPSLGPITDTLSYSVSVIDDAFPMISVVSATDSSAPDWIFFHGSIKDDYGFSKLQFIVEKGNVEDSSKTIFDSIPLNCSNAELSQDFFYNLNIREWNLNPGDFVRYHFVVWDNDGINGPKPSRSTSFETSIPTEKELNDQILSRSKSIQSQADKSISELRKIQEEINEMLSSLVNKKDLTWQDKKQLEQLRNRHNEIKDMLQSMRNQIQENNRIEEQFRDQSLQLLDKQQQLDKLFDKVMTDEMKELMNELDKLMNNLDKNAVQEELENLKLKNEDIEKQLDQNIELLKRFEIEKQVEQAVNKAQELAQQQRSLAEKTKSSKDKESSASEQSKLSEQFQQLKKDIQKIQDDYKNLHTPEDFKSNSDIESKIEYNQKNAQQQIQKNNSKEASKSQQEAAEQLDQLAEQLAQSQLDIEQQDLAEDAEQIRHLLKNIVLLSKTQESLISLTQSITVHDPKYQSILLDQNLLKNDFVSVEDSLRALAQRQVNVASMINKELSSVNTNINKSLNTLLHFNQTFYGNYKNTQAAVSMQYSMTSLNNLALVLAESLDQMQNQMRQNQQMKNNGSCKRQGQKKSGSCSNPGKGKPSPQSMKQMQDELNKQMKTLKEQLDKQGQKPNGRTKIGEGSPMSKEFARMAAQQEQIRRMMQEYGQELKQNNAGNAKLAREIDDILKQMEQTETDLVNRTITAQTIQRQQNIMSRLLQHEKADLEQEKDERRQSKEADRSYQQNIPPNIDVYNRLKNSNLEQFYTVPPSLNPYYKNKVNDYFFGL